MTHGEIKILAECVHADMVTRGISLDRDKGVEQLTQSLIVRLGRFETAPSPAPDVKALATALADKANEYYHFPRPKMIAEVEKVLLAALPAPEAKGEAKREETSSEAVDRIVGEGCPLPMPCDPDSPAHLMPQRAMAAIALRVPRSGDPAIDAMIREARRLEVATAVLAGMAAGRASIGTSANFDVTIMANDAARAADALLAAGGAQ